METLNDLPNFSTPKLAEAVQGLSTEDIDRLPFGVIGLDSSGVVRVFNKTEARLSGRGDRLVHGLLFFVDIAPCMDNGYFKGRIDRARAAGTLDIAFNFIGDFEDRAREISVRAQSSSDGGIWIFHHRIGVE